MKSLRSLLLCGVVLAASPSVALETPVGGPTDERIRFVDYTPNDVVKVVGRFRASTQIEFDPGEEVAHVAIGDAVAWEVAPANNILFLKPREKNPPTNLQVVPSARPASGVSTNSSCKHPRATFDARTPILSYAFVIQTTWQRNAR